MMNAVPIGHEDGEASQVKYNRVLVENKERLLRKAFLVVMLAFVVVCSSIHMGTSLDNNPASNSSSNLFGERSLKGLFGHCGKKDDPIPPPPPPPPDDGFTPIPYGSTPTTGLTVASGETKMYKTTVPKVDEAAGRVSYSSGGGTINLYMSFDKTKPLDGANTGLKCNNVGDET